MSKEEKKSKEKTAWKDPFESVETGEKHWMAHRAEVDDLKDLSDRQPAVDIFRVTRRFSFILYSTIDPVAEKMVDIFNPAVGKKVRQAQARLWPLSHGLFYTQVMKSVFGDVAEERLRVALRKEVVEAAGLGNVGRHWLDILERLGVVGSEEAALIREGRGIIDLAADLQAYGALFSARWPALEPIQAVEVDESFRLTKARVERMKQVGTSLAASVADRKPSMPSDQVDWRRQVLGFYTLLERDYTVVQSAARCYLELEGRWDDAAELVSFRAMNLVTPDGQPLPRKPAKPEKPAEGSGTPVT